MSELLLPTIKNINRKEFKMSIDGVEAAISAIKEILGEAVVNMNVESQLRNRAYQIVSAGKKQPNLPSAPANILIKENGTSVNGMIANGLSSDSDAPNKTTKKN